MGGALGDEVDVRGAFGRQRGNVALHG
uniref:Uncharacterized protein n=1 Tax=Anguilla anguilla TaxID=7936 RepID=A0A0E9PED8_ANGAN